MQYGALLIVDPEEENYPEEITKLADDVAVKGMGLIVVGEWYNVDTMVKMRFFDDNTRSWWTPATGADWSNTHAWRLPGQQVYAAPGGWAPDGNQASIRHPNSTGQGL